MPLRGNSKLEKQAVGNRAFQSISAAGPGKPEPLLQTFIESPTDAWHLEEQAFRPRR